MHVNDLRIARPQGGDHAAQGRETHKPADRHEVHGNAPLAQQPPQRSALVLRPAQRQEGHADPAVLQRRQQREQHALDAVQPATLVHHHDTHRFTQGLHPPAILEPERLVRVAHGRPSGARMRPV